MNRNIYVSVEFGTHTLKLLVSEFFGEKQNILFLDEEMTKGIEVGHIIDKMTVQNSLKKLISRAEKFLNARIKAVILMLPSVNLWTKEVTYDITIPENMVKGKHIKSLFNKVYTEEMKANERGGVIASVYPNKFTSVKMRKVIDNPVGELTRELSVNIEIVYENQAMIVEYISVIEQLGIEVIEIMPNVVGYKNSLLMKDEMKDYACVVDVGANTTTITIYNNQLIERSETFKIGSSIVTQALMENLGLSYEDSEDFKITHGNCVAKEASDEIIFEKHFPDGTISYITHEYVTQIIEEKYLEIIRVIKRYLLEYGLKNRITHYYLIGGGVAIENFERLFKNNFGEWVSIRRPNLIGSRHPKYSSIISGQYNAYYFESLFEEQYNMIIFNDSDS
ncbi:MAG: cell division protein FtsA [Bacilli bacterium]|nr:cell division protein FtsA [Bacilli bacterium]